MIITLQPPHRVYRDERLYNDLERSIISGKGCAENKMDQASQQNGIELKKHY